MRKVWIVITVLSLVLTVKNAFALSWDYYGDYNGDIFSGLTVGYGNVGNPEDDGPPQPIQISGAGTILPLGYPQFTLDFHADVTTWDSYNASGGFFDVFAAVLSDKGYYWNLPDTNIHPLENNPALLLGYDPFNPTPGPTDSYWGGLNGEDGLLDRADTNIKLVFNTNPAKQYYLSLFLQTTQDEDVPSWGTFSNVRVTAAPEPVSIVLFLGGGVVLFGSRRFRKRSLKKA